ncbi:MAG TPA: LLM class flavin-dependent oxidoreductase [Candidatus Acidoferrales bacterium]|jgi:alkanesulfonate monooxygenase SsuD/methylene tetrahydromethanopterin reductase-like flavin-dependent oxidoreductase (luciferase family)|nr:LLM class flavin-dependent oxidoreductase [Candidatus Acidoferrales bacterium]
MANPDHPKNPIFNDNKLKLGTFCTNTIANMTFVPELLQPTWANTLAAARLADEAGLEAVVPIARWKGYLDQKPEHQTNNVLDVFAWAAAMAQATRYTAVFATSHAPTMHPLMVARMSSTIDAISGGRFALNVVGGWNRREFEMFGIELLEHDDRYVYLEEWLQIIRKLWMDPTEFNYESKNFHMKKAISRPQPLQKGGIPIMNAALSPVGMRFSAKHSQIGLISPHGEKPEDWRPQVEAYKRMAREEFGREIQLWTNVSVVQRETQKAAEDYLHRYAEEYLDNEVMDSIMATISKENNIPAGSERLAFMRRRMSVGAGHPLIGTPESIAKELATISAVGIDGVIMTWPDYIDGVRRFNKEVLPLLEQAGLRKPFRPV